MYRDAVIFVLSPSPYKLPLAFLLSEVQARGIRARRDEEHGQAESKQAEPGHDPELGPAANVIVQDCRG